MSFSKRITSLIYGIGDKEVEKTKYIDKTNIFSSSNTKKLTNERTDGQIDKSYD